MPEKPDAKTEAKTDAKPKLQRPDRDACRGLPAHAQFQARNGTWYVYFPYDYSVDGKRRQDRDYIGKLDEENNFVPNLYYLTHQPTFENRPVERWRNPVMKERALAKLRKTGNADAIPPGADLDPPFDLERQYSVGATALAVAVLKANGLLQDLSETLEGNLRDTLFCTNLAMRAAVGQDESEDPKYLGIGCPDTVGALELFERLERIGRLECGENRAETRDEGTGLAAKLARLRVRRLDRSTAVCVLDGARLGATDPEREREAAEAADPKNDPDGVFTLYPKKPVETRPSLSLLMNVETGDPICFQTHPGTFDCAESVEHFRNFLSGVGIPKKRPTYVIEREAPTQPLMFKLNAAGLEFLCIDRIPATFYHRERAAFYTAKTYLRNRGYYGLKCTKEIRQGRRRMETQEYVFRNPVAEMTAMDEILDALERFEKTWDGKRPTAYAERDLYHFFVKPQPGVPLVIDDKILNYESGKRAIFSLIGNAEMTLDEALDAARRRDDAAKAAEALDETLRRVTFPQDPNTPNASTFPIDRETLESRTMTGFVALGILFGLRGRLAGHVEKARAKGETTSLAARGYGSEADLKSVRNLLRDLGRIRLTYSKTGKARLVGVTQADKALVKDLGFPGLFDSADAVAKLLSAKGLAESLQ